MKFLQHQTGAMNKNMSEKVITINNQDNEPTHSYVTISSVDTLTDKLKEHELNLLKTADVLSNMIQHYDAFLVKYDETEKVQHSIDAAQAELNQQTLSLIEQANKLRFAEDEKTWRKIDENDCKYRQRFKWLWLGLGGCGLASFGTLILQIVQMCIGG